MTSTIFDDVTRAFVTTLEAGTLSLGAYSLPLLGTFALIGWYWNFGRALAMGGGQLGDALAAALLYAVNIGIAYWLLVNLSPMTTAAYQTFLQWGMAAGGNAAAGAMVTPSTVVDTGFQIAATLHDWTAQMSGGWAGILNAGKIIMFDLIALVIQLSFPAVALALMVTQIEYHLAVMLGAVLLPFGVFGPTAFFTEFSIGWITGGLLRVLITAVLVGIGAPLFSAAVITLTAAGNPTHYSAVITAVVSLLYAGLCWWIPNKASTMCGRVALGLSGSTVVSGAMTAARFGMAGVQAVRGFSRLMASRQA